MLRENIWCQLFMANQKRKPPICIIFFSINFIDWQENYWIRVALELWSTINAITTVRDPNHRCCSCISSVPVKCKLHEPILCGVGTIYFCRSEWLHPAEKSVFIQPVFFKLILNQELYILYFHAYQDVYVHISLIIWHLMWTANRLNSSQTDRLS